MPKAAIMPERESWRYIGQRIRWLRKSNQLTIKQLAKGCGLSSNAISLVERGEVAPTVSTLCKIAHALGTTLATFFDEACPDEEYQAGQDTSQEGHASIGCSLVSTDGRLAGSSNSGPDTGDQSRVEKASSSILCVCGQLEYTQEDRCHLLGPGEVMPIDHTRPHFLRNTGKETGIALLVFPPGSDQPSQETE